MTWNEATMVFLNFWNFFSMFLEFSITCRVGTKRNDNFCFPSFSAFFNVFWLEMKSQWYSFNFFKFLLFFWNFPLHVMLERNMTIVFILSLSQRFPPYFGLKLSYNCFYNSLNFFAICLKFSKPHWVGTKRNANLYFICFSAFSHQFLLEKKP